MAEDIQRLVVALEARTAAFEKAMNRANGVANKQARAIESRFSKVNKTVSAGLGRVGGALAAAFVSGAAIRGAQQLVDSATRIENALKVAGLAGEELTRVYDRLFASAQRNAAPLESLVELYGRAALVQKELGVSSEELLRFTDSVAVALRVSGKSAQEASGALLQLSQALGSGVVRAEEFNSILEGALPIAQAAAAGLEEAGGSVAKLRQLVIDGAVSSEAFFRAFEAGSVILQDKVASAEFTVSQGFTRLNNVLIKTAGELNDATGASQATGEALLRLADAVEQIGDFMVRVAEGPIGQFIGKIDELNSAAGRLIETLSFLSFNDEILGAIGNIVAPKRAEAPAGANTTPTGDSAAQAGIQSRIDGAFNAPVKTVSLKDFSAPSGKKSGGGGGSKSKRANDYEREVEQIRERTAALIAETQAMAGLNPLVDDYGFAVEKARAAVELETAAKKAGLEITPALKATIDELATSYANASVAAEQLAESQEMARQAAEDMRDLGKDVLGGFIKDLRDGKSASEALAGALQKVADKLLEVALNSIFDGGGGGGFGGLLGGIGKIFGLAKGGVVANGRPLPTFARGGVSKSAAIFGEAGPEAAVPLPDGRRIPVDLRIPSGGKNGGTQPVAISVSVEGANGDAHVIDLVRQGVQTGLSQYDKQLNRTMGSRVAQAQTRQL